jgi:BMFP domain-containing protein YqiC
MEPETMDTKLIEELARKLVASVPPGVRALQADMEQNFRALLEGGLARMNLVTREEFDVQQRVLERSREKLQALEARIAELESRAPRSH